MIDYSMLESDKLVNLLFAEEDRLPRAAVDEFIRRGNSIIEPLSKIVLEESNWDKDAPEFWTPIHAVFILGATGAQEAVPPLITAIKWSEKYNVDWVFEVFPSIFGKIGMPALESLRQFVQDKEQDWYVRTIALQGLAAVAVYNPEAENDIIFFIHSIFTNKEENIDVRVGAANVLLDFKRDEFKESLLAFCEEERKYRETSPFSQLFHLMQKMLKVFSPKMKKTSVFTPATGCLFYDEEHIKKRQERWKTEAEKKWSVSMKMNPKSFWNHPHRKHQRSDETAPVPAAAARSTKSVAWGKIK